MDNCPPFLYNLLNQFGLVFCILYLKEVSSLNELYTKISNSTKYVLYQFIKDNDISLLNYNFNYLFQYYIQKYKIEVISHHFSNHKTEGLTIIDEYGISFSYEKDNPKTKQNFTLCHELGHFILNHSGSCFTESVHNKEDLQEREANIFSAIVLMPDIVLLSKIYYSCDSFKKVQDSLGVSKLALYFRLLDLFREFYPHNENQVKQAIEEYIGGQNASTILLFHNIKEKLISEFSQFKQSFKNQLENYIFDKGFVSSQELPELLKQENWYNLKKEIRNLKIWLIYDKGKTLAYAWDSTKYLDDQARKKAEFKLHTI